MVLLLLPSLALDAGAKARPGNDLTSNIFFPLLLAVSLSCANMYKERERARARHSHQRSCYSVRVQNVAKCH